MIDRAQAASVIIATLSIVVFVLLPRPYSVILFWVMIVTSITAWLVSIWLRFRQDEASVQEAKAEVITTAGFVVSFFLVGWLVGFLVEGYSAAWVFGFITAIAGFIVALAPLRRPPRRPPDSLPGDE